MLILLMVLVVDGMILSIDVLGPQRPSLAELLLKKATAVKHPVRLICLLYYCLHHHFYVFVFAFVLCACLHFLPLFSGCQFIVAIG